MVDARTFVHDPDGVFSSSSMETFISTDSEKMIEFLEAGILNFSRIIIVNPSLELIAKLKKNRSSSTQLIALAYSIDNCGSPPFMRRGVLFDRIWDEVWLLTKEFSSERTRFFESKSSLFTELREIGVIPTNRQSNRGQNSK